MAVSLALLLPNTLGCSQVAEWWLHALVRLTTAVVTAVVLGMGRMCAVGMTTAAPVARPTRMLRITVGRDAERMVMVPTGEARVDPAMAGQIM